MTGSLGPKRINSQEVSRVEVSSVDYYI